MQERKGIFHFKGNPLTLLGPELKAGDKAPDFTVVNTDLQPVTLSTYAGKVKVFNVVPSLDTPVCDQQTRKFNDVASGLSENVVILTFSVDLPFAQKRWCGSAGVDRVITLSDYKDRSFGLNYGLLIKEMMLLARAVLIVDAGDRIRYIQIVPEMTNLPDFDDVLNELKNVLEN